MLSSRVLGLATGSLGSVRQYGIRVVTKTLELEILRAYRCASFELKIGEIITAERKFAEQLIKDRVAKRVSKPVDALAR